MSQQSNQLAQYKDALKLLKKKCQVQETQLNGWTRDGLCVIHRVQTKAGRGSATSRRLSPIYHSSILRYVESVLESPQDQNPQPTLSLESLKQWWVSVSLLCVS